MDILEDAFGGAKNSQDQAWRYHLISHGREGGFYPSALEKGMRSERALLIALAGMYLQGVSTRRVKAITEELCGVEISAMQVSWVAQKLDEVLQEERERSLGEIKYLHADDR